MKQRQMQLSSKNSIFIYPKIIDVMMLLDDDFNKESKPFGEVFSIVIQPIDGRRNVIYLTRVTAEKLAYSLLRILGIGR